MLLSSPPPDANALLQWILAASLLLNLAIGVSKVFGKTEKREITGTVREEDDFVTRDEHDSAQAERKANVEKLERVINEKTGHIEHKIEAGVRDLRKEMKDTVAEAWARITHHSERISSLGERVAALEARPGGLGHPARYNKNPST